MPNKMEIILHEEGCQTILHINGRNYTYWGLLQEEKEKLQHYINKSNWKAAFAFLTRFRILNYKEKLAE
jgi:pterin-4a-carbinolamine dehydratase